MRNPYDVIVPLIACASILTSCQNYRGVAQPTPAAPSVQSQGEIMSKPQTRGRWRKDQLPHGQEGDVIAFSSDGSMVVAGQGTVLLSQTNGRSWKALVGGTGSYRSTVDGGNKYSNLDQLGKPLPSSLSLKRLLCSAESAVLTSSGRLYVKTVCEHITQLWSIPTRNQAEPWNAVVFTYKKDPSDGVYSAGHNLTLAGERVLIETNLTTGSALLTTDDNGATWYPWWHGSDEDAGIVGLSFIDERTGWMLEGNGSLLKTMDGGRRWESLSVLPSELAGKLHAVEFADPQTGFIAGANGLLLVTNDGGRSWERRDASTTQDLYKLAAADAKHVWAVGRQGTVLETSDGGSHWPRVDLGIEDDIQFGLTVKDGTAWLVLHRFLFRSS